MHVILADDQPAVRSALRLILEDMEELSAVGEATEGQGLLAQVRERCPDLVLLDWELPGLPAAQVLAELRLRCQRLRVIVLSGRPEGCAEALAAGADAFVSKGDPPERLLAALRAVHKGNRGCLPGGGQ